MQLRLLHLNDLYFEVTNAIDDGAVATTEEVQAALENENMMELLDRFHEIDLSLYDDEEREAFNRLFKAHALDRSKRLGYTTNGLGYAAGVIVKIIVQADWVDPDSNEKIDVSELVIDV